MNEPQSRPALQRPLGQELLARGAISPDQLEIALREQLRERAPLGRLLTDLGFISEATLRDLLAEHQGIPGIDLDQALIAPEALARIPKAFAQQHHLLPLNLSTRPPRLSLAMANAWDVVAKDRVRALLGPEWELDIYLAGESEIAQAVEQHYGGALSIDAILKEIEEGPAPAADPGTAPRDYQQPVIRLVDALLADGVRQQASDIHFEPEAGFLRIRYRIDGLLRQIRALHLAYWPAMAVRLKVMSGLNIAESRAPQDGHFQRQLGGRRVDFRVSTHPTLHGENLVLRILDRHRGLLPLAALGLAEDHRTTLERLLHRPEGILLVTGPTGAGKTTTLYSLLAQLNQEGVNLMTLEDPVEYPTALMRQSCVNEGARLDFANGIRTLMRQDPDIILVGEIRDPDTAIMAFRAAMTGHQVFSTLHANSALGAIPRLKDLGIGPDILSGNLIGVVAQRLVRKICPHCRETYAPTPQESLQLGLPGEELVLYRGTGCDHCQHQGYRGRVAIMELWENTPEQDDLIAQGAPLPLLRAAARQQGLRSLQEDGWRRVLDGTTTLAELLRVVGLPPREPAL